MCKAVLLLNVCRRKALRALWCANGISASATNQLEIDLHRALRFICCHFAVLEVSETLELMFLWREFSRLHFRASCACDLEHFGKRFGRSRFRRLLCVFIEANVSDAIYGETVCYIGGIITRRIPDGLSVIHSQTNSALFANGDNHQSWTFGVQSSGNRGS